VPESSAWFVRMEKKRGQRRISVGDLVDQLGISRATYYQYRSHPDHHPRRAIIDKIADFLGEDATALATEMAPAGPPPTAFLEAAAARALNTRLYQQHVRALAHVLSLSVDANGPTGLDVAVRLLRENLPAGEDGVDAIVAVAPVSRGRMGKRDEPAPIDTRVPSPHEPYQYQIYVVPKALAHPHQSTTPSDTDVLRRTREKVDKIMDGAMLPVTREHSPDLRLPLFGGKADVLLYPGLLDMRSPDPAPGRRPTDSDVLVTGVYYAGAPDVAALLARELDCGFSTFDQLTRLQTRDGLRGLPSDRFKAAVAAVAHTILTDRSPTSAPMIWATDDPDAILGHRTAIDLQGFPGVIVLLLLSEAVLDYAAYRLGCVDEECPDPKNQARHLAILQNQQVQLRRVTDRGPATRRIVKTIELPSGVERRPDGSYPDAVDAMFHQYEEAFRVAVKELKND
jgi:transcriptional regulator with XRE-family HTH domain